MSVSPVEDYSPSLTEIDPQAFSLVNSGADALYLQPVARYCVSTGEESDRIFFSTALKQHRDVRLPYEKNPDSCR
jgi:hypothetical protein